MKLLILWNNEMDKVVKRFNANRLLLNVHKTHFMIFYSSRKKISCQQYVRINNESIEQVKDTKFIGVKLDETLTWEKHISMIKSKIARDFI